MTQPPSPAPRPSGLWARLWLPLRRLFSRTPDRGPRLDPEALRERTSQVQLDLIEKAFGGIGGDLGEREKNNGYLCHPRRVLLRAADVERLDAFFDEREDSYGGRGRVTGEVVGDLVSYELPDRVTDQRTDVHATLDELDRALREQGLDPGSVARPDHIVYVTPGGIGKMCPATEPDLPLGKGPLPGLTRSRGAGDGVRVSVVDTGWYAAAETNPESPWLAGNIEGDLETVNPTAIHPYAGHGTFVAGVVRCLAPGAYIEIEGVLTKAGAVYESEITKELNEAMSDRDKPDLISISAGTYTRNNLGLIGFEALAAYYELTEGESAVLVVAAAGNDSSDRPFWPAAFPWVVAVGALDADGCVSDFSNVGKWVDVYAHGRDLVNAFPTGTYTCHEPANLGEVRSFTGLAQWSGTSFSTPVVTGLIAAYMSENGVSARDARDAILAAGLPFTDPRAGSSIAVGPPFV
jgi:Subtilase family